ncbi:MAG: hypothetical protein RIB46_11770 [Pseudomonadales bacterium]
MSEPARPLTQGPMARLLAAVEAVAAALEDEAEAIVAGQPEQLLQAVSAKAKCLRDLETLARDPRVAALMRSDDDDVQRLIERLRDCEQRNLATGSAIVMARRDNEVLLRAIGHQPEPAAYTPRGAAPAAAMARTLGKA